jgi:hypothetical protein
MSRIMLEPHVCLHADKDMPSVVACFTASFVLHFRSGIVHKINWSHVPPAVFPLLRQGNVRIVC